MSTGSTELNNSSSTRFAPVSEVTLATSAAVEPDLGNKMSYAMTYLRHHAVAPSLGAANHAAPLPSIQLGASPSKPIDRPPASLRANFPMGVDTGPLQMQLPNRSKSRSKRRKRNKSVDIYASKSNLRGLVLGFNPRKSSGQNEFGDDESREVTLPTHFTYSHAANNEGDGQEETSVQENAMTTETETETAKEIAISLDETEICDSENDELVVNIRCPPPRNAIPQGRKSLGNMYTPNNKLAPLPYNDDQSSDPKVGNKSLSLPPLNEIPSLVNPYDNPIQVLSGCTNAKEVERALLALSSCKQKLKLP